MRRIAAGDRRALEFVYRATSAKLFGICLRIAGDRGEAEDALQDVYVSLWNAAGRFDPARASPVSWLAVFARNRTIDRLRRRKRVDASAPIEAAADVADASPLAEDRLLAGEERAKVHSCLDQLDEPQRGTIRTAFFEGVTYAELASRQSVPLGTVKSWVRRGLARLKACIEA
ncbi:RNA polymerase subunit sigma [Novosphingobium sp. TH158]|nr:sigma-70 family RNA polymerase sigma factor [Novosphingobium sp. TH158]PLK27860.1 RNA polymerase subunit sigma [Novosphingobium sp. TH158]